MSPRPSRARPAWHALTVVTITAIGLAGCNSSNTAAVARVTGIPSIGISVPLHTVACTTTDSCIALGTTGAQLIPTSVAEYRQGNGNWSSLNVPAAPSSVITSASCWKTGCLVGGIQPSGSLLWGYNASSQSVSARDTPSKSQGVRALDCFADASCTVVVNVPSTNVSAIAFTSDGGTTWSDAAPIPWTLAETVKSVSCTDGLDCMVSAVSGAGTLDVEVTHDAGVTWTARVTPTSWQTLASLHCAHLKCVGLAMTDHSSVIVRTSTFGRLWNATTLPVKANALACTTMTKCVIGGQTASNGPWLATLTGTTYVVSPLRYVPSPVLDVACGTTVCAGIGVSTVLALHP